jgi:hypothetical protein
MGNLITIHDGNWQDHHAPPPGQSKGLKPRDYTAHPVGCFAFAPPFPDKLLIPPGDWPDRLAAQKASNSRLIDVRNIGDHGKPIPALDQNGKGYCWAHSSTTAMEIVRAVQGEPFVQLSAYAIACIIKHFKDDGGFGGQSLQFIADRGVPSAEFWPLQSMDKKNDNPATWANAAEHKFIEWFDLEPRNLEQFVSCLLLGYPVVTDLSWWGHSICTMCLETVGPTVKDLSTWILNSWGNSWSQNGAGILKGTKALPDAMLAARVGTPSGV